MSEEGIHAVPCFSREHLGLRRNAPADELTLPLAAPAKPKTEEAVINMKRWTALISVVVLSTMFLLSRAKANGMLTLKFQYVDSNGVATPLSLAYVYLHDASALPPMEQYFSQADYIFGPSDSTGAITASVPAGSYYLRITRRNTTGTPNTLGPPMKGDYTWFQAVPIIISNNLTTNLGTVNSTFFGSPITISGTITNSSTGAPLPGRYVRAQSQPCITGSYSTSPNYCGPDKFAALTPTDANGNYTLQLKTPGNSYLYQSSCIGNTYDYYTGNPCMGSDTGAGNPVTVQAGASITVNFRLNCSNSGGTIVCN